MHLVAGEGGGGGVIDEIYVMIIHHCAYRVKCVTRSGCTSLLTGMSEFSF